MKQIPLTQGKTTKVDDADYESLNRYKWHAQKDGHTYYAIRRRRVSDPKQRGNISMHRDILNAPDGVEIDHRDGKGLNNRRANLRFCTGTQNQQSARKEVVGTSRYKGVCWVRRDCKWISRIRVNKKLIYLGCFNSGIDGALAYDLAAVKHFGEFAMTNEMLGLL